MTKLDAKHMAKPERDEQAGDAGYECQQVILAADAAHAFKKFASIKDPDAVEKHDQPGETDRAYDLRLRCERADGESDEQYGADTERKGANPDLADQIANADGKKNRENWLCAEDLADGVQHEVLSRSCSRRSICDDAVSGRCSPPHGIVRSRGWRVRSVGAAVSEVLVFQIHRLPLECTKLMKRLHFDPLDVFHRRHESCDALDIRGVIGGARHQREPHPHRLAERSQPFGKAQGRSQLSTRHLAIGFRIRALDVEQHEVDAGQVSVIGAVTEKSRCFNCGVQAHTLGRGKYSSREAKLHHRLAARDGQAAIERTQRGRKALQAIDDVLRRNVGSVLQMPGVWIVAVGAAQQAARYEQDHP